MRISLLRSAGSAIRSFRSGHLLRRTFVSGGVPERKVVILGAGDGVGQSLSLLLKLNPLVTRLDLYDTAPGVAYELDHINTPAKVFGYVSDGPLGWALEGSDVVIIVAGNKCGINPACMPKWVTRDVLFNINASTVKFFCTAIAMYCPNALVNVITFPVNLMVPIAAEVFKKAGTYNEKKLFGVTTLDVVRAKTFYARKAEVPISGVNVPVVGGHEGVTILPLFSQATPATNALSDKDIKALTKNTQDGVYELLAMTRNNATVSMAYAGAVFADACLKGLNGFPDIVECSFVQSTVVPELPFFASKVRLGKNGVEEVLGLGSLSEYEQQGLENLKAELKSSIEKGIKFAEGN